MAIQNNLKAIFYGKVGQLVGQRYKDKSIVRTYTKPKNPRTPAQQKNRAEFAKASRIASFAMSINYKAPCWDSPSTQEYALRLKTARIRLKNGSPEIKVIPIYPDGYAPKHQINDLEINIIPQERKLTITSEQLKRIYQRREYWLYLQWFQYNNFEPKEEIIKAQTLKGSNLLYEKHERNFFHLEKVQIMGVSIDDRENNNEMVYIHIQTLHL